ncbi:MAG: glutathione S-transferase family protein [Proteobacteria bacterium]|nr:glutathione S-transferase family protein [Pseudomonadota bacterium]
MRTLYHHPLSSPSRKVRLVLSEKDLSFTAVVEKPWDRRTEFLALSPGGEVPVLVEEDGFAIPDANAILEYIEETRPNPPLLSTGPTARAKVRALAGFFDRVFFRDVVETLVVEKALKRLQGSGEPDGFAIRRGYQALEEHLKYINYLAEQHKGLASDALTLADLTAAAHLSVVDYLGDIAWDKHPEARAWYSRMKSRPSFRPLLADHIPGLPPPVHYANLDF